MNNIHKLKSLAMLVLVAVFMYGCAAKVPSTNTAAAPNKEVVEKKVPAYSPVGVWEYTVDTPDGGGSGIMRITGEPGTYEATLETDQFGTLEIENLDIVGMSMTGTIEVAGTIADIEGDFDGDDFSGAVIMGDQVFPLEGTRTSN